MFDFEGDTFSAKAIAAILTEKNSVTILILSSGRRVIYWFKDEKEAIAAKNKAVAEWKSAMIFG